MYMLYVVYAICFYVSMYGSRLCEVLLVYDRYGRYVWLCLAAMCMVYDPQIVNQHMLRIVIASIRGRNLSVFRRCKFRAGILTPPLSRLLCDVFLLSSGGNSFSRRLAGTWGTLHSRLTPAALNPRLQVNESSQPQVLFSPKSLYQPSLG